MDDNSVDLTIKTWLNKIDQTLPPSVELSIKATLNHLPPHSPRAKWNLYVASALLLLFSGLIVAGLNSPGLAESLKQIPLIGSLFDLVGDSGIKSAGHQGYATSVNQTVTDQNISLTLKEVMYDGTNLNLAMVVKGEPHSLGGISCVELIVDGKEVHYGASGWQQKMNDRELAEVQSFTILGSLRPQFNLQIRVNQVGKVRGTWIFETTVSTQKAQVAVRDFSPKAKVADGERQLMVKKVIFAPSSTMLEMELILPSEWKKPGRPDPETGDIRFQLITDQGLMLDATGQTSRGNFDGDPTLIKANYMPISRIPRYVVVKPVIVNMDVPSFTMEGELAQLPSTLSYGSHTKLQVIRFDYLSDKTVAHFEIKEIKPKVDPYELARSFRLKDAQGNMVFCSGPPVRENESTYQYRMDFPPVKVQDGWQAVAYVREEIKAIEPLQVKIPLN